MTLDIELEWQEAPGVSDPILARTWARMSIQVDGRPVTRYWSSRVNSVRDGVYGSVFPLAEWIVNHWWFLLYEGPRQTQSGSARRHGTTSRPWLMRHNMLTCREGMAYPDLAIFRKDDAVTIQWFADPDDTTTGGRFLGAGIQVVERRRVEAALESLLEAVVERTQDLPGPALDEVRELWSSIRGADSTEARSCSRLAMLGLDPYGADADEAIEQAVERLSLEEGLVVDVLALSSTRTFADDLRAAHKLLDELPSAALDSPVQRLIEPPSAKGTNDPLPHRAGYARASAVRAALGLPKDTPLLDLASVVGRTVGKPETRSIDTGETRTVDAAVQLNGRAVIVATPRSAAAQRFLEARALHHWLYVTHSGGRRLLTHSHDWVQAASRAFSAELLAPASALAQRLRDQADLEYHGVLAEEFGVGTAVITHQIDNHRLG